MHRKHHHDQLTFSHLVRVHRELRAAALARRSGVRQGLADRQDAGRRLAAVREPAAAVRLHVGASGQEAAVHGRRVRPAARMEARWRARMARAAVSRARRRAALGADLNRPVPRRAGAARASISTRRASSGSTRDDRDTSVLAFLRARARRAAACSSSAISRRCRARTTRSAFRAPGSGASC